MDVRSYEEGSVRNLLPFKALKPASVPVYSMTLARLMKFLIRLSETSEYQTRVTALTPAISQAIRQLNDNQSTTNIANVLLALFHSHSTQSDGTVVSWFIRLSTFLNAQFTFSQLSHTIVHLVYCIRATVALRLFDLNVEDITYQEEKSKLLSLIQYPYV